MKTGRISTRKEGLGPLRIQQPRQRSGVKENSNNLGAAGTISGFRFHIASTILSLDVIAIYAPPSSLPLSSPVYSMPSTQVNPRRQMPNPT